MSERVAIVGSRSYPQIARVKEYVDALPEGTIIVSGGAAGVDSAAERAALKRGLKVVVYFADWKTYGKRAGFLRNEQIAEDADRVVAFWDGESRGTMHTIELATRKGKPVQIIRPADYEPTP